jgi:NADH-quinone oxidoreductase subunit H
MNLVYQLLPPNLPEALRVIIAGVIPAILLVTFMALGPILYVYGERKIAGFMQDRLGPMRVGPYGLLQTIADAVKLLFKEAIYPRGVDRKLFLLAPCLVVLGAFLSFVVIPFGSRLQPVDFNMGAFYVVAVSSLSTVGLIMAGWASNNKYALFGAMRSAAQIVSYEIPAVMTLLLPVMLVGSLSLQKLVQAQAGGLPNWLLWRYFPFNVIAFLIFFTAGLAECNRTPFDIPEAESELVAGFHTEYSGFFFAMFFMAEYTEMFVISAMASVLFLGGYWAPHPALQHIGTLGLGPLWFILKAWSLVFIMMWLRWTLPRLRVDQLMYVAWKVLLPMAMTLVVVVGGLAIWAPTANGWMGLLSRIGLPAWFDDAATWFVSGALLAFLVYVMFTARRWSSRRVQEYAA